LPNPGIMSEIRLLARSGSARFLVTADPPELGHEILPHLPPLLLDPSWRSIYINAKDQAAADEAFSVKMPNEPCITAMQACAMKNKRRKSDGPHKHPWFGRWFADQMEPPPKMRMRTATEMKPDPTLDGPDVLKRFLRVQENIS
jgi:hypothetical protein